MGRPSKYPAEFREQAVSWLVRLGTRRPRGQRGLPAGAGAAPYPRAWTTALPCSAGSTSTRASVVLQRGFGAYALRYVDQYARLVPRLLEAGFEVWALDLWGHGRSPGRRALASVRLAVADHLALRQQAAASGLPVVPGRALPRRARDGELCSGGTGRPRRCGAADPALPRPQPSLVRRVLGALAAAAPDVPLPERRRPVSELSRIPTVGGSTAADHSMYDGQVMLLTAMAALDATSRLWSRLPDWHVPMLVVHGTADTYTEPERSRELVAAVGSQDKALHLVEGDGGTHRADLQRAPGASPGRILRQCCTWSGHAARGTHVPAASLGRSAAMSAGLLPPG